MEQVYCKPGTLCSRHPLDKKKIPKKVLQTMGKGIIPIIALTAFISASIFGLRPELKAMIIKISIWVFISLVLALLVGAVIYQVFYYRFYFYDMIESEIIIKKGVIGRREMVIPFSRIQDIYVDQDVLDRIFGLYDVHIATAATGGYQVRNAHI
jgi:putative membrane protein